MKHVFLLLVAVTLSGCAIFSPPDVEDDVTSSAATESFSISSSTSSDITMMQSSSAATAGCYPGSCGIAPMTDEEIRAVLSASAYDVMRKAGTERPYSSPLNDEHRAGTYVAADTGEPLFRSEAKFDSGTGWPSFYEPINGDVIVEKTDRILGYARTEVLTRNGSHLGHVFSDGPEPTGLRYCINGIALRFIPDGQ